jgi:hypothetical protein
LAFKVGSPSAFVNPPAAALGDSGVVGDELHARAKARNAAMEPAAKSLDGTMNIILV